ncbi:MAG: hypothetical protein ACYC6W_11690 [Nitrosotalea sp.]
MNKKEKAVRDYIDYANIDRNREIWEKASKGILGGKNMSIIYAELAVEYNLSVVRIRAIDKAYAKHLLRVKEVKE